MKQIVSFDKLKLTNNQLDENGHVNTTQSHSNEYSNWLNIEFHLLFLVNQNIAAKNN